MSKRMTWLQLLFLAFVASLAFLLLARIVWSASAFGLLAVPLFFLLSLFSLTLIFYYLTLAYLLLRSFWAKPV